MKLIRLFSLLAATASLGACATSGDIINSHVTAAGIIWNPAAGVTAGYAAANHTFVPLLVKGANGVQSAIQYPDQCGRAGPPPVSSIQTGNATANATSNQTGGSANPTLQIGVAVNQGLLTGEPARLDELAKLQAAAGSNHPVLTEYNACPQALPTSATGAATSTPAQ